MAHKAAIRSSSIQFSDNNLQHQICTCRMCGCYICTGKQSDVQLHSTLSKPRRKDVDFLYFKRDFGTHTESERAFPDKVDSTDATDCTSSIYSSNESRVAKNDETTSCESKSTKTDWSEEQHRSIASGLKNTKNEQEYTDKVFEIFQLALREDMIIKGVPLLDRYSVDLHSPKVSLLLELRTRQNEMLIRFTISWTFLLNILKWQSDLKRIFRVYVDRKIVRNPYLAEWLLRKMRRAFGNRVSYGTYGQ